MALFTTKEEEVILTLFADYSENYNANSLSQKINITPRGTLKILKKLEKQGLLVSKQFGKAIYYKVNLEDYLAFRMIETLLIAQSRLKAKHWLFEFEKLFDVAKIVIVFGSAIRDYSKAKDIDVMVVVDKKNLRKVQNIINERREVNIKPIQVIFQSSEDLRKNLSKRDPVVLNVIRKGHILHGFEEIIEDIKNVTSF